MDQARRSQEVQVQGNLQEGRDRSRSPRSRLQEMDTAEAIKFLESALSADVRARMGSLVEDGTIKQGDFDPEALAALVGLNSDLQDRVLTHLETERIFLMSSRSKSGFLVSACEKARSGALDCKGIGARDPWHAYLMGIARPRPPQVCLVPEADWLQRAQGPIKIVVDVSADSGMEVRSLSLALALSRQVKEIKTMLVRVGCTIPCHKMRLKEATLSWLLDDRTLAYYNLGSGCVLQLVPRKRGGVKQRKE